MVGTKRVRDWGGLLAGVAALAGVALTYMQALTSEDVATRQAARQEARLEKAYEMLVESVNRLSLQGYERDVALGRLRETVGEIRGSLSRTHQRELRKAARKVKIGKKVEQAELMMPILPPVNSTDVDKKVQQLKR